MSLELQVKALAEGVGADVKTLLAQDGSLAGLSTANKTSLVAAINEVLVSANGGDMLKSENLAGLADYATARSNMGVASTAEITSEITMAIAAITLAGLGGLNQAEVDARVQEIVGMAPAALDTLNEIAASLGNDANFAATVANGLAAKVDFNSVQSATPAQQLQACNNIGVGNPEHDFVADYVAARDSA